MRRVVLSFISILSSGMFSLPVAAAVTSDVNEAVVQEISPEIDRLRRLEFNSSVLQEKRVVDVYLPARYNRTSDSFPVVYVLDGEYKFLHTAGILDMLYQRGYPPVILVSIPNPDNATRTRDLTPEPWGIEGKNGGGADAFADFIASEVAPEVDERFRTRDFRILVGHSFGGLFATHVFASRPEIFNAYISISPSVFYADYRPLETFSNALSRKDAKPTSFYFAMGAEPGEEGDGIHKLYSTVESRSRAWLDWRFQVYQDETHVSVVVPATMDGLKYVFRGFVLEGPDLPQTLSEIKRHYAKVSTRMGWIVPPPPRVLMNATYRLLSMGDSEAALKIVQYFAKIHSDMPASWYILADVQRELGNQRSAIAAYQRYLEMVPDDEDVRQQLQNLQGG